MTTAIANAIAAETYAADVAAAKAAAADATATAKAAHACAAFAAQAVDDALSCVVAAGDDPDHAAAHRAMAAEWAADAAAHRESFHASMATAAVWDATATAAERGLSGRLDLARALVSLVRRGRVDFDRAVEVIEDPAAWVTAGEVVIEDPDGVGYSLWGQAVYW